MQSQIDNVETLIVDPKSSVVVLLVCEQVLVSLFLVVSHAVSVGVVKFDVSENKLVPSLFPIQTAHY